MSRRFNASFDAIVIGGGLVGLSLACGLTRQGLRVAVCDEGDRALRASRGNFGLVWVQGKGADAPAYARLTARSAQAWPAFAAALRRDTGIDPAYAASGGLSLCLDDRELAAKAAAMAQLQGHTPDFRYERLDAAGVRRYFPAISDAAAGAIFSPQDGHANPLALLHALLIRFTAAGGRYLPRHRIETLRPQAGGFTLTTSGGVLDGDRVILAAGLGNAALAPQVGLRAPVAPLRGQVMITERLPPLLAYPTTSIRQTADGTVQIGDSQEAVGYDDGTRADVLAAMAQRAIRLFPRLRSARVVRAWGALRVMTPDGLPIYAASRAYPGAFVATCHSGVTLAAVHHDVIAPWMAGATDTSHTSDISLFPDAKHFHDDRFAARGCRSR